MLGLLRRSPLLRARSSVGLYRTCFIGDPARHTHEFAPVARGAGSALPPGKRADLTLAFKRYRDVDQSDSALRLGHRLVVELEPEYDIANDVDFACLCLNACHLFRITPPVALLEHIEQAIAPKVKTSQQLETLMSAFREMAEASRTKSLLTTLVPRVDAVVGNMSRESVVTVTCCLIDAGITPPLLIQSLIERAVMLLPNMAFHDLAQLCLAIAVSPTRPADIKETFETEFAPRLMHQVDFAMAQDLASVLYAFAEVGVAVPEMVAQCASRLYAMHQDLDSDGVAMTFSALALMELRAPKLTKALLELVKELDLSSVTALAALDMAYAMAHIGVEDDIAISLLTGRIMADRQTVLSNPAARSRLVRLSEKLVHQAKSQQQQQDPQLEGA